jgi:hypothetical protein
MTDNIELASIFRLTAVNFWESAKKLDSTMEKRENGSPAKLTSIPFYFLISHAVELFLKSALLKRGFTVDELKNSYAHDLQRLLEALQKKGVMVTHETVSMINGLHSQHKNHALRYSALLDDGQATYLPPPSLVHQMLEELLLLTRLSTQGK